MSDLIMIIIWSTKISSYSSKATWVSRITHLCIKDNGENVNNLRRMLDRIYLPKHFIWSMIWYVSIMMMIRYWNMNCNGYYLQVIMCLNIRTHARLHSRNENKTQLPGDLYEVAEIIWWKNILRRTTKEKCENHGENRYLPFSDNTKRIKSLTGKESTWKIALPH